MKRQLFLLAIFSTALANCVAGPIYVPPALNAPLLTGKGETQVAGYVGTNGYDLQGAVAVTDEIALTGAFSFNDLDLVVEGPPKNDNNYSHIYGELGAGYLFPLDENWKLEGFVSAGGGKYDLLLYDHYDCEGTISADGSYWRGALQVDVGGTSKTVDFGAAARVVYVGMNNRENSIHFTECDKATITPSGTAHALLIEPVLFARVGYDLVKVEIQLGLPYAIAGAKNIGHVEERRVGLHGSLGLRLISSSRRWKGVKQLPPSTSP